MNDTQLLLNVDVPSIDSPDSEGKSRRIPDAVAPKESPISEDNPVLNSPVLHAENVPIDFGMDSVEMDMALIPEEMSNPLLNVLSKTASNGSFDSEFASDGETD